MTQDKQLPEAVVKRAKRYAKEAHDKNQGPGIEPAFISAGTFDGYLTAVREEALPLLEALERLLTDDCYDTENFAHARKVIRRFNGDGGEVSEKCPTCDSPNTWLHPIKSCEDTWHWVPTPPAQSEDE